MPILQRQPNYVLVIEIALLCALRNIKKRSSWDILETIWWSFRATAVWPDWTIFERSLQQIFLQMETKWSAVF